MPKFKETSTPSNQDVQDFFGVRAQAGQPAERQSPSDSATIARNKATVRRILEAFNTGNTSIIDELANPNLVTHTPYPGVSAGVEGLKSQISVPRSMFPDGRFEEEVLIAEGDMVFLRWKMTGTHLGRAFGREPTGKRITHYGHEIIRLDSSGKIIEHMDTNDVFAFLDELGLLDAQMLEQLRRFNVKHPSSGDAG
jgi:predicted ester cyclase